MSGRAGVPRLEWPQVCARRLERHALASGSPDANPAGVAGAICGAHAQVLSAAELSLGLRLQGATRTDVRDALWTERSLVKTYGPRGTVHLLPTRDLPTWTGALSAIPSTNQFPDEVRLTAGQTEEVVGAIGQALEDAELTVEELGEAVLAATGPWAGDLVVPAFQEKWPRWRQAITVAAHRGALCFGPNRGRRVTYTNPHRWLPDFRPSRGRAALTRVVRHYLRAYGPATSKQFAQWIGGPPGWAAELFDSLAGELREVEFDGSPAWLAADDTPLPETEPEGVRLLPYFDAYTVGSHPRKRIFQGRAAERALSRTGQAGTFPVLLVDGTVAGVWHLRRSGRKLDVTVESLRRLGKGRQAELDDEVERIGRILEGTPRLTMGTVTVGGHA
ncbi:winged helix DNA-binding domain-containing protein [Micromonospora sp. NPDC049523]|uniref:winged helix DNA-binding domain-containing protein n=1 Tax=Micromonospora sp. NPDC049523 TaxID=3155921 RepID=UPI0034183990